MKMTPMKELMEELKKDSYKHNHFGDTKSGSVLNGIAEFIEIYFIEKESDFIRDLQYHKDTTSGLWATDTPELIPDNIKDLFFQLK